jgi:hypothetical protein
MGCAHTAYDDGGGCGRRRMVGCQGQAGLRVGAAAAERRQRTALASRHHHHHHHLLFEVSKSTVHQTRARNVLHKLVWDIARAVAPEGRSWFARCVVTLPRFYVFVCLSSVRDLMRVWAMVVGDGAVRGCASATSTGRRRRPEVAARHASSRSLSHRHSRLVA